MESNTWCPRLTARIILSGSAVHVKGFGSELCSTTKRLIATCKSTTDTKTPRFNRRFVSLAKRPSTALSHDAKVGVKWKVQRGWRRSAGLRVMEIPVRMRQTRMPPVQWESPPGFKCQTRSTRTAIYSSSPARGAVASLSHCQPTPRSAIHLKMWALRVMTVKFVLTGHV
jgi:hypothetical protein